MSDLNQTQIELKLASSWIRAQECSAMRWSTAVDKSDLNAPILLIVTEPTFNNNLVRSYV